MCIPVPDWCIEPVHFVVETLDFEEMHSRGVTEDYKTTQYVPFPAL